MHKPLWKDFFFKKKSILFRNKIKPIVVLFVIVWNTLNLFLITGCNDQTKLTLENAQDFCIEGFSHTLFKNKQARHYYDEISSPLNQGSYYKVYHMKNTPEEYCRVEQYYDGKLKNVELFDYVFNPTSATYIQLNEKIEPNRQIQYNQMGVIIKEILYEDGLPFSISEYYQNGNPKSIQKYCNETPCQCWVKYLPDGVVETEECYEEGSIVSKSIRIPVDEERYKIEYYALNDHDELGLTEYFLYNKSIEDEIRIEHFNHHHSLVDYTILEMNNGEVQTEKTFIKDENNQWVLDEETSRIDNPYADNNR